jgi:hypothetical protein
MRLPLEELAAFLREKQPFAFCPGCVARGLFVSLETATKAAVELALASAYRLTFGSCSWCGKQDFLTSARPDSTSRGDRSGEQETDQ